MYLLGEVYELLDGADIDREAGICNELSQACPNSPPPPTLQLGLLLKVSFQSELIVLIILMLVLSLFYNSPDGPNYTHILKNEEFDRL
jgi:hypothetical protein